MNLKPIYFILFALIVLTGALYSYEVTEYVRASPYLPVKFNEKGVRVYPKGTYTPIYVGDNSDDVSSIRSGVRHLTITGLEYETPESVYVRVYAMNSWYGNPPPARSRYSYTPSAPAAYYPVNADGIHAPRPDIIAYDYTGRAIYSY